MLSLKFGGDISPASPAVRMYAQSAAFFASGNCFNWILLDHQIISDCRIIKYLIDMHQMLLLEFKQLLLLLHAAYFPVFPLLLIFQCSHGAGLFKAVAWPALNPAMPGMAD